MLNVTTATASSSANRSCSQGMGSLQETTFGNFFFFFEDFLKVVYILRVKISFILFSNFYSIFLQEPSSAAQNQLQKWVADEPLGENATIAMILYANINHADLKHNYPKWEERVKQIAKIWKNLPNEKRQPYVTKARENRTASRMNRGPVSRLFLPISLVNCSSMLSDIHKFPSFRS